MAKYIPDVYQRTIADIDYGKLKSLGIKCIIFDLDNTIALINEEKISASTKKMFEKLREDFIVVIVSNNFEKRISSICNPIDTPYVSFAMKPFSFGFKKVQKDFNLEKEEMCIIGDQLMTDILGGNRFGIYTILVDPMAQKDMKITSINRRLESEKIKKLTKMKILERGKYYGQ